MSRCQDHIQSATSRNRLFIMAQKPEFTSLIINIKVNNKTIVTKKKRPDKKQTR